MEGHSGTKGSILFRLSWLKNSVTVYPHLPKKPQRAEGNLCCCTALSLPSSQCYRQR